MKETALAIGPVDILTVKFPTERPSVPLAPVLADLAQRGLIRVLDLAFVSKTAEGDVVALNLEDIGPDLVPDLAEVAVIAAGQIDDEDVDEVATFLEPGTSAALLVFENTWAAEFAEKLRASNGEIVDYGRLPREAAELLYAELTGE
jgi:hypothetical protein